ncbi:MULTISPECIES: hypothetical protein [Microbacterium]|uniref:hypothetical protein n=1 Tax=Microbacterium TaxID=33882 RepID=UPI00277D73C9|nr:MULTISPECIES: hypothetical protein [Microbacterium]MDQ1084812.1 hypothetical protein [Microbacterium sp. SORGH_AS_0344]MDQ1169909.1 hypothetical protein [Microbacterium proteolyticum]
MTSGIRLPDAITLVHGEHLALPDALDLDLWSGAPSPFEFDIDPVPHGTGARVL